jgi:uncharacterized protein (TIGR01777 family)
VVNLAGTPVRPRPWTQGYRQAIRSSRLDSTATVSEALAEAVAADPGRPRVLLSGSAVGYYGDTGDAVVDESFPAGADFLAQVCAQWEAATAPAEAAGVRVAHLRTGLVIGHDAMLVKILGLVFRLGLGGRMGSGRQYWPWISLRDEVDAIRFLLTADVSGPVNLTGPTPVTNAEFARSLAGAVHRPAVLPVPGPAISLALGEFGRANVLSGQRAVPAALEAAGYRFGVPTVDAALQEALARS